MIKASKILNDIMNGSMNGNLSISSLETIERTAHFEIERRNKIKEASVCVEGEKR